MASSSRTSSDDKPAEDVKIYVEEMKYLYNHDAMTFQEASETPYSKYTYPMGRDRLIQSLHFCTHLEKSVIKQRLLLFIERNIEEMGDVLDKTLEMAHNTTLEQWVDDCQEMPDDDIPNDEVSI